MSSGIIFFSLFSFILAWTFISLQIKEFQIMGFFFIDSVYNCVFFFLTGLHFFHLFLGLLLISLLFHSCSFSFHIFYYSYFHYLFLLSFESFYLFYNIFFLLFLSFSSFLSSLCVFSFLFHFLYLWRISVGSIVHSLQPPLHSLGSTASQGTSNIPFPLLLFLGCNSQAQEIIPFKSS